MTLTLDFLTAGLNGPDGLIREHYMVAKRKKAMLRLLFLSQRPKGHIAIDSPVRVIYTRYCSQFMDWDNACASFKYIGDSLKTAGIIADDSPKVIAEFDPRQVLVKRGNEHIVIEIKNIQPA